MMHYFITFAICISALIITDRFIPRKKKDLKKEKEIQRILLLDFDINSTIVKKGELRIHEKELKAFQDQAAEICMTIKKTCLDQGWMKIEDDRFTFQLN